MVTEANAHFQKFHPTLAHVLNKLLLKSVPRSRSKSSDSLITLREKPAFMSLNQLKELKHQFQRLLMSRNQLDGLQKVPVYDVINGKIVNYMLMAQQKPRFSAFGGKK